TAAAEVAGIATSWDCAWQQPGPRLHGAIETWKAKARGKAHVDYGFHVMLSEATPERIAEVPAIVADGYPSLKVFMINEFGIGDGGLLSVFEAGRAAGAVVNVHAENGDMLAQRARTLLD